MGLGCLPTHVLYVLPGDGRMGDVDWPYILSAFMRRQGNHRLTMTESLVSSSILCIRGIIRSALQDTRHGL